ncbi:FAD binding domain-containing protein [Ancylobacter sp. 6x-1]|uniref:FAD binding domain-containing protein n=1 Tax=Ancylobacter crimeensis TaxID=2579147 RepID=A0ABT0DBG4_9HYPH|nr:FAD binding domain-containing protein [Ancylobacter crimeensis]MCK0197307.1 FAD binding domain-containing protein [Ancylobacter crimeensis]
MKAARFDYHRPADLTAALTGLGAAGGKPLSGGQSLGPMLNLRLARPAALVDVGRLAELRRVEERADGVLYGAAITHAEIEDGAVPDPTGGILPAIASGIAYRAVRNRGTMGGSLAHADPAADWPTTLAALGAIIHLTALTGPRESRVPDLIRGAFDTTLEEGEIISGIFVPRLSPDARWGYRKSCRKVGEFAEAMAAVLIDPPRNIARLVIGATETRHLVLEGRDIEDSAVLDAALAGIGIAADPARARLFRAVVADALSAAQTSHVSA